MTVNSIEQPRAFSWRRILVVNATLALTFLPAALANIATANSSSLLRIDLLALTIGFLASYILGHHKSAKVSARQWLSVSALAVVAGWSYNLLKILVIGA